MSFASSSQGCDPRSVVWALGTSFPYHTLQGMGCLGTCCCWEVADGVLPGLQCPHHGQPWREPWWDSEEGSVHSQVHHDNSRHFRGNYQRVSLNNQFPSALGAVLTRKGTKEGDRRKNTLLGSSGPPVPSNFSKLNAFSLEGLRQTIV